MPKLDVELASALKQAKSKPMFFAFVAKGSADGKLLVSKAKIPATEIAEAKAAVGGGTVWQGRCQDEDGVMVFQVPKEPPGTIAGAVKKIINRDAGLSLPVMFRLGQGLEDDGAGGSTAPTPPSADVAGDMTALKERIKVLKPQIDALKEKNPAACTAFSRQLLAALASAQARDFDTANRGLNDIAAGLKTASQPAGDAAGQFAARLKKLLPDVQKAQAAATPAGQEVKRRAAASMALAGKKDYAAANAALDQLEPLLKQALAPSAKPVDEGARFTTRLKALSADLQHAQALPTPAGQVVKQRTAAIMGLARNKEYAQANAALDRLEPVVKKLRADTGGAAPDKVLGIWQEAKEAVDVQITKLTTFFRGTGEPDYEYLADHGLTAITKRLQVGLITALMTYDSSSGPAREPARLKAQAQVEEFKKFVQADPAVALFDDNPFGVAVTLRQTLGKALDDLTRALKA